MVRVVGTLLIIAFTIYTLVDCLQTEDERVRNLPKMLWALLICFFPIVGAAAWYFAGRPAPPQVNRRPERRGPIGPDDDPDFLRGL